MGYLSDEDGAVTVDWVVMTAALVGLGLAVTGVVSSGVDDLSSDVRDQMTGYQIWTSFPDNADFAYSQIAQDAWANGTLYHLDDTSIGSMTWEEVMTYWDGQVSIGNIDPDVSIANGAGVIDVINGNPPSGYNSDPEWNNNRHLVDNAYVSLRYYEQEGIALTAEQEVQAERVREAHAWYAENYDNS